MRFLSYVLATLTGLILFSVLSFFFFVSLGNALSKEEKVTVKENSVLTLSMQGVIVERTMDDPFAGLDAFGFQTENLISLIDLKETIRKARDDEKIKGIYLKMNFLAAGYSSLSEIRQELQSFKESGKFIVAYGEILTEGAYYLASVADEIYAPEEGVMEFNGLVAEVAFFSKTLEKLGVEPLIFRVGEFKSAIEPFIRTDMSEASRLQMQQLLDTIYINNLREISADRNVAVEDLKEIAEELKLSYTSEARDLGLITDVIYEDEIEAIIKEKVGEYNKISYGDYKKVRSAVSTTRDRVAVIVATGNIVSGEGDNNSIGSDRFVKAIRKVRKDDNVKAVVLRVNSPGGSVLASDLIWHELTELKKVKPVVASMSDVAASGGYYISMICDTIVAMPNTITGSIGIFGVLFNAEEFLDDKLGVTTDRVTTAPHADLLTLTHPMSEAQKTFMQRGVEKGYDSFISKVAAGRNMTKEQVLEIASGRVWSGEKAKEIGLVDVLGTYEDALAIAAEKAGLEEYKVRFYPDQKTVLEQLIESLETSAKARWIKNELGSYYTAYEKLKSLKEYEGLQARMFNLTIQ